MNDRVGKFLLIKELATGGMAEIFIARKQASQAPHKLVVIKMLRPDLKTNREYVHLFLNEARIASRLMHPNVVQMYDLGYADGDYFIAMEYVHGENLHAIEKKCRKEKRPLSLELTLSIIAQICDGLHHAHTKTDVIGRPLDIVHCDMSPQNILVGFDGYAKILDFGVARASSQFERQEKKGTVKGKLPYLAPEQILGKQLDPRTDVYATGVVLWELVTGHHRYRKQPQEEIVKDIVSGAIPPPRRWNPDIPGELEAAILKALAKNPKSRFQTAEEFGSAIREVARRTGLALSREELGGFLAKMFPEKAGAANRP